MNLKRFLHKISLYILLIFNCSCSENNQSISSNDFDTFFSNCAVKVIISNNLNNISLEANKEYYCDFLVSCEKISNKYENFTLRFFIDTQEASFKLYKCDTINYEINDNYIDFHFIPNTKIIEIGIALTSFRYSLFNDICSLVCLENCYTSDRRCTAIFKNHDGTILQCSDINYGDYAAYNKISPTKASELLYDYSFAGWSPSLNDKITKHTVFVARYNKVAKYSVGDIITVGEYPQSLLKDESIIKALDNISFIDEQGYKTYCDIKYYYFDGQSYINNDGKKVSAGGHYYIVEPIKWKFLGDKDGNAFVMSEYILDCLEFDDSGSNYLLSDIRQWLNNVFLNTAFYYDNSMIEKIEVDNSAASTNRAGNKYACQNTYDKVFLLSNAELTNVEYGFSEDEAEKDANRQAKTTEYARAVNNRYSKNNDYLYNGVYWTRSHCYDLSTAFHSVGEYGRVSHNYYAINGVRPAIVLSSIDN